MGNPMYPWSSCAQYVALTSVQEWFKLKEIGKPRKFVSGATSKLHSINGYQTSDKINVTKTKTKADTRNHKSERYKQSTQSKYTVFLKLRHRLGSMPELDERPRGGYANSLLRGDMPSFGLGKGSV